MMRWSSEERAFAVEAYFSNQLSVIATQRAFRNRFNVAPRGPVPDRKSIITWVTTFRETGSTTRRGTGAPRPVRSSANIEAVRASILEFPGRSARQHASALGLSDRSVRQILKDDLHCHPYTMAIAQELSEHDFSSRRNACEALLENVPEDALVYFSDEAHFHLTGCVNKENMRYYATDTSNDPELPLHSPKVTVWCAISSTGIIGPWFFEENEVKETDQYVNMLKEFFLPRIDELDLGDIWFQQDGATTHTSKAAMAVLTEHFPERLISIMGDLEWPDSSPDLSPCDFYLWGYLKSRVYVNNPSSLPDLKANIREEIAKIPAITLARVLANTRNRFVQCIDNGGRQLSDMIVKTI
uniref:Transposable element Tc3 transposase n=1 Tax=Lepeophtheirus salmonis TaxID=72036 RepID=D3PGT8_LEPSM|nr:Transposable element Tc3 transposase [Lepeophtheirus salmonis]